jgi:pectinesterase
MKQVLAPIIALVIGIGTLAFMAISPQVCHGAAGGSATVARSIFVSKKGSGADFTRIQDAINSVPFANRRWIRIHIAAGVYK